MTVMNDVSMVCGSVKGTDSAVLNKLNAALKAETDPERKKKFEAVLTEKPTEQSKSDAVRYLVAKFYQIKLGGGGKQAKAKAKAVTKVSTEKSKDGEWHEVTKKGKKVVELPRLANSELTSEAKALFELSGQEAAGEICFTRGGELLPCEAHQLTLLATERELVDMLLTKKEYEKRAALACMTQAKEGALYLGGSRAVHDQAHIRRVSVLCHRIGDPQDIYAVHCWLVNFGKRNILHRPREVIATKPNAVIELKVRVHKKHSEKEYYDALVDSPVKLLQEGFKTMLPQAAAAGCERMYVAFKVRAKKQDDPDPGVVQGFLKMTRAAADLALANSGQPDGFAVSLAGGCQDKDHGLAMVPLPEGSGPKDYDTVKALVGVEHFRGLIPVSNDWKKWGVRLVASSYATSRPKLDDLVGDASRILIHQKWAVIGVPKGMAKDELTELLKQKQMLCICLFEARGAEFQTQTTTTYVVGTSERPPMRIVYLTDDRALILREWKDAKDMAAGHDKEAAWVQKFLQPKKEDAATKEQQQPEASDVPIPMSEDEGGGEKTMAVKLRTLAKRHIAATVRERKPFKAAPVSIPLNGQIETSSSEDIVQDSKRACLHGAGASGSGASNEGAVSLKEVERWFQSKQEEMQQKQEAMIAERFKLHEEKVMRESDKAEARMDKLEQCVHKVSTTMDSAEADRKENKSSMDRMMQMMQQLLTEKKPEAEAEVCEPPLKGPRRD